MMRPFAEPKLDVSDVQGKCAARRSVVSPV